MSLHEIFNYLLGLVSACLAWFAKTLHDDLKEVKKDFQALSIKVVGEYVHKDQLVQLQNIILDKLNRIEDKLDAKADKE